MAKQLYDYWFVQFDFPDENGRPYKSSGGEMVWNEKLKRKIPASWENKNIEDIADVYNGATPSTINEQNYGGDIVWITPKDLSDQKQKFVYQGERNISQAGYNSCSTHLLPPNTILMSSRAPIGLLSIAKTELCTNQNLTAMAKQLYDYWFVQFDFPNEEGKPYKSSGGEMVWNKKLKREIPKGWNISLIKDFATTYSGGTPKSTNIEYYNNGEIAWINSGELNSPIITKTTNYITKCGLENSSAKLYPSNSILVAMYGATAGKVSLLTFEACSNQAVCGIIPTIENMLYYVYFHISSLYSHFITLSTGSARDNISQNTIKNILLPIPTRNILKLFDEKIGSIYQMIVNNYQQIDSLAMQRDELLPLLMNGQVSVNSDLSNGL